jgi:hypothetical protein
VLCRQVDPSNAFDVRQPHMTCTGYSASARSRVTTAGSFAALDRDPGVSPTFEVGWLRLLDSKRPEALDSRGIIDDSRTDDATRVDVSAREPVAFGPNEFGGFRAVEDALAFALAEAARAGRWDIVAQLARELEALRLKGAGLVELDATLGKGPERLG